MWLVPSTVAIGRGARSVTARQTLDKSDGWFPVPGVGFARINSRYFVALGSGAVSFSCALRGPVRSGIPVTSPL
jgi:hypothetical protein